MEELKQIIDNKCAEFKGLKIYTGWFYDFAEMLLQQGYTCLLYTSDAADE